MKVRMSACLFALFVACAGDNAASAPIRLYAGGGVREPVTECIAEFEERTGLKVEAEFGHSGRLFEKAIEEGGDLYLAGDIQYVDEAERRGLVEARQNVGRVTPVIVTARGNPKNITCLKCLGRKDVTYYLISAESCQLGMLGERLLAEHGLKPDAPNRISARSKEKDLAAMLASGEIDAALTWKRGAKEMGDAVEIVETKALTAAACPLAAILLRDGAHKEAARKFLDFLGAIEAATIFRQHGFDAAPPAVPAPLARPDYNTFDEADAVSFDKVAKSRTLVYKRLADYLIDRFDLKSRPGIGIDIGGGPGDLVLELAARTEQFYWIDTDINTWYMRPFAEGALEKKLAHRTGFVFADTGYLPFKDNYADLAMSRGAYQFWGDLEQGLREIHRVLKPGGEAFIGRGFPPTMPPEEIRDLFSRKVVGGPKYDPDADADRFESIAKAMDIREFEVILHRVPEAPDVRYGVWFYFKK